MCTESFAMIDPTGLVRNIAVGDNSQTMIEIAVAAYGEGSTAVICTNYGVGIGDTWVDNDFYKKDTGEKIGAPQDTFVIANHAFRMANLNEKQIACTNDRITELAKILIANNMYSMDNLEMTDPTVKYYAYRRYMAHDNVSVVPDLGNLRQKTDEYLDYLDANHNMDFFG